MPPKPAKSPRLRSAPKEKRKYHSPLRQQQLAETRERIIAAGVGLVHELPTWDWRNLSARAVGERAGVSERTVHRHFSTERKLRDAVLQRLVEESGVDLDRLELADFSEVTARTLTYLSSFSVTPETPADPSQSSIDEVRRQALLDAVRRETPRWSPDQQRMTAAILDMAWQPATLDRLKLGWGLEADDATRALGWMIGLVRTAIAEDRGPGDV